MRLDSRPVWQARHLQLMAQALLSVGHERADHDGSSGGEGHAPKEGALDRVLESREASVDINGEGE